MNGLKQFFNSQASGKAVVLAAGALGLSAICVGFYAAATAGLTSGGAVLPGALVLGLSINSWNKIKQNELEL